MDTYSGIYIFEGIDNVGKTTIIHALKKQIQATTDYKCVNVAFPGNEPRTLGELVYRIHHHEEQYFDISLNEASLQLLHIASHIDLIQRCLEPLSNSKCIVLLDRFWWSTYVYGLSGGLEENIIQTIIAPELLYWKDINVKKIFLIERNKKQKDYELNKENTIIEKYRQLADKELLCTKLDNNESLEKVVNKVYRSIFGE
jgi:dTMP kinase